MQSPPFIRRAMGRSDFVAGHRLVLSLAALDAELCAPFGLTAAEILETHYDADLVDFMEEFALPRSGLILMEIDGIAVGCAGYTDEGTFAELRNVFLDPAWRGSGRGRLLVRSAMDAARDDGHKEMRLVSYSLLTEAVSLYLKFGFAYCAPFGETVIGPTAALDLYMSRPL